MTAAPGALLGAAMLAVFSAAAAGAPPTLSNAWLRPAAAGDREVPIYVDIRTTEATRLIGAASPIAANAQLVLLDPPDAATGKLRVVEQMPLEANRETRLAVGGSHIRLGELQRDANPGDTVRVELTFEDAAGRHTTLATEALVRGLVPRRAEGATAAPPRR